MPPAEEDEYVLGTHDDEIARLGLQHRVWRAVTLDSWRRAGIALGSRVIDVGAGPGYATADLAELVGPQGKVLAVERSGRFLEVAKKSCAARGLTNVEFREADLMEEDLGDLQFDMAWCRWVACFVPFPEKLVRKVAGAIRKGGVVVFHEYSDYKTWRVAPRRPTFESFVHEVMESWRASGGDPDVALALPAMLSAAGLRITEVRPHILAISPNDYAWQWPASFIQINLERLRALGRVTAEWAESVQREFDEASRDPSTILTTPLFLEMIAQRE